MVSSSTPSCLGRLRLLLLLNLQEESAVDVRENTSESDRGSDKGVELLVSTDGQLEMAGGYALDLEVLGRVLRESVSKATNVAVRG